jgi:hypothetical protein
MITILLYSALSAAKESRTLLKISCPRNFVSCLQAPDAKAVTKHILAVHLSLSDNQSKSFFQNITSVPSRTLRDPQHHVGTSCFIFTSLSTQHGRLPCCVTAGQSNSMARHTLFGHIPSFFNTTYHNSQEFILQRMSQYSTVSLKTSSSQESAESTSEASHIPAEGSTSESGSCHSRPLRHEPSTYLVGTSISCKELVVIQRGKAPQVLETGRALI